MKLTKKLLNENKIYNPHGIATATEEKLFIGSNSVDNGKVGHSANWAIVGIKIQTDPNGWWGNYGCKTFIFRRDTKESQLAEAKAWVKKKYDMDMTEKDVWGNWHVTGTMAKLEAIIKGATK
jgi:hypothetical protein